MSKKLNLFCLIMFIGMFTSSLVLTVYSNSIMDSEPIGEQYSIPINRPIGQSIVYHEWEPKISSTERDNRVCFLFAGFLASQEMMYPLMRELTGLGYHVITGDFQGHGYSGGLVSMNWSTLLDDFDLIYNDVITRNPTWNSTHVAIAGHSMGGFAVSLFGSNRSYVHTTVAFAPATHPSVLSEGSINNYMLIIGELDELIPPETDWAFFQQLGTSYSQNTLAGNPINGNGRKFFLDDNSDHATECMDDDCLSEAVSFIEMGFGYLPISNTPGHQSTQSNRMLIMMIALILGILSVFWLFGMSPEMYSRGTDYKRTNNEGDLDETSQINNEKIMNFREYMKNWWKFTIISIPISIVLLILSFFIIWNGFSNLQVFFFGVPGITSLLMINKIRKKKSDETSTWNYFKSYWNLRNQLKNKMGFLILIIAIISTLNIIYLGIFRNYIQLIPMNGRFYSFFILMPYIFIMISLTHVAFMTGLNPNLSIGTKGNLMGILIQIFNKYALLLGLCIILLFFGNYIIILLLLLILVDIAGTAFIVIGYRNSKSHILIAIWTAIIASIVYIGYSGLFFPLEIGELLNYMI